MQVTETKVLWVLKEASLPIAINQKPRLSSTVNEQLLEYVEFKADFHHMYIRVRKDPQQKWFDLPYLSTDDAIQEFIKRWLVDWNSLSDLAVGTTKGTGSSAEKKKEEAAK